MRRGAIHFPRGAASTRRSIAAIAGIAFALKRVGKPDMAIAALRGIDAALDRRRRRDEDDGRFLDLAAHNGHVAGVVSDAVLLLIGALVFFIDDERCEIREGKKQRRARADDDLDFALGHARHSRARLRALTPECHSPGRAPKRAAKRPRNCAVSAISGIRIRLWRPAARAAATASK